MVSLSGKITFSLFLIRSKGLKLGVKLPRAHNFPLLRLFIEADDRRNVSENEAVLLKLLGLVDTVDPTYDERSSSKISDSESESPLGEEEPLDGDPLLCKRKGVRRVDRRDKGRSTGTWDDRPNAE